MPDAPLQPPPSTDAQIRAMVSLLSDTNPVVVEASREALGKLGPRALPWLDAALPGAAERHGRVLRSLLARARFPDADQQFVDHLLGNPDLERGALLLARVVDGGPEPDQVADVLDELAERVAERLPAGAEPQGQIDALRSVLVDDRGLSGVPPEVAVPADALLHGVTHGRGGMPLPLCMVYLLVARRLNLPLVGLGMPGHFLLGQMQAGRLAAFDAFSGAVPVPAEECQRRLSAYGMAGRSLDALRCDDTEMLVRCVRNVAHLAATDGDRRLVARTSRILRQAAGFGSLPSN